MRQEASLDSPFARLGAWLARRAKLVVGAFAGLLAVAGWYGASVSRHLAAAGLEVPGSESQRAAEAAAQRFGVGAADVLLLYRNAEGDVRDALFGSLVFDALAPALDDPGVLGATTLYETAQDTLVSRDGRETLVVLSLAGEARDKVASFGRIEASLRAVEPPMQLEIGGLVPFTILVQEIAHQDAAAAERWALPIALALTLLFFRSAVAALLPVAIGAFALAGSAALTRLAAQATEISIFAMNIGAFLGLGLSIDYALLLVQRFREELARGRAVPEAVAATLDTAGRAVWVSAAAVGLSLAALVTVPLPVVRSAAIGGALVVASAVAAALGLLPALLALLGPHVNFGAIGRPRDERAPSRFWRRVGTLSLRHPAAAALACVAILAALASPALRMRSAMPDARALPAGSEVRRVDEALADPVRFRVGGASAIPVVVRTPGDPLEPANLRALRAFAAELAAAPGVEAVRSAFDELDPDRLEPAALARAAAREPAATALRRMVDGDASLLLVEAGSPWRSDAAAATVAAIRTAPRRGLDVQVGGSTAQMVDMVQALRDYAGLAVLLVAGLNFLILLGAFRSLAVPLKALAMNLLSIGASYGVLVWVFQEGHGARWLGFEALDGIDPTIPLVMFAVVFGLSMDYEVFLLSRIQEEWRRTRDNAESVLEGLARTGRIITSAALILLVVVGAFVAGDLVYVKQIGLGIAVAIAVDVTIVRALLVPATMQLLGEWNWWAPRWLRSRSPSIRPEPASQRAGTG